MATEDIVQVAVLEASDLPHSNFKHGFESFINDRP
jgi:hypothetical protein